MAALRASGFAPDEALKDDYGDLLREQGDGTFKLTLFGLAATANSARHTDPFIPLVRRAIEVFIQAPRARPRITTDDLRAIAESWTADELSRVGPLFRDALGPLSSGSTTRLDGVWEIDVTERCLRFRRAVSVWDYWALKNSPDRPRTATLDSTQRRMAIAVLAAWRSTGRGPDLLDLALAHLDVDDPIGAWEALPEGLFRTEVLGDSRPLRPNMHGLLALRPETDADLRAFVRVIAAVHDLFSASGAAVPPTAQEVATRTGFPCTDVVRLIELTDSVYRAGVTLSHREPEPLLSIDEHIFSLEGVRTLEDLVTWVARRDEEKQEWKRRLSTFDVGTRGDATGTAEGSEADTALAAAMATLELHPEIARASSTLFANGHYRNAVLDAAVTLVNLVKRTSGCGDQDGTALMRTVFSRKDPTLAFNDLANQSDLDEQEGLMHLFEGAVLALRNPRAHVVFEDSPESALECIALLSLLAKRLDRTRRRD